MCDVILAMNKDGGIGLNGKLPWRCREELKLFRQKTMGGLLVVGRKTAESLPPLRGRKMIVVSDRVNAEMKHIQGCIGRIDDNVFDFELSRERRPIFIIGGAQLYNKMFSELSHRIRRIHLSIMKKDYRCDTFVKLNYIDWVIEERTKYDEFTHYVLVRESSGEKQYLSLLKDVYENGWEKKGRNGLTKSMFGKTLEFDLRKGFPLLTTKKMFFRGIVEELLFFIRGDTDTKKLEEKKINIWKGNTSREFLDSLGMGSRREGVMGQMYGYQWRNFNAPYDEEKACFREAGLDQLRIVIDQIKNDPHSRRILLTDYNPLQAHEGVLYPCHSITIQFYVQEGYLDMFCYNRSSDLFHGLPFNIASSALFHTLISKVTGLVARKFILSLGDCHIYQSHYDVVQRQLKRSPFRFPRLQISKELNDIDDIERMEYNDFTLENRFSHSVLKVKMVV